MAPLLTHRNLMAEVESSYLRVYLPALNRLPVQTIWRMSDDRSARVQFWYDLGLPPLTQGRAGKRSERVVLQDLETWKGSRVPFLYDIRSDETINVTYVHLGVNLIYQIQSGEPDRLDLARRMIIKRWNLFRMISGEEHAGWFESPRHPNGMVGQSGALVMFANTIDAHGSIVRLSSGVYAFCYHWGGFMPWLMGMTATRFMQQFSR